MKKIKSLKVFCIICSLTILLLCPAVTVSAQAADTPPQAAPSGEETIQPHAPIIKWVFKEENGIIYRRLYNYSTGEWIGDWIPCD
ncbi:hypothetical protein AALA90_10005 [Lachnospiraceae bacterium 38-10]